MSRSFVWGFVFGVGTYWGYQRFVRPAMKKS